ncbi:MAG: LPS export ABC transporter periplasmic protein LptC [Paludibacteraceae bacterium]|nr:LPS export ABC transporter periplasmic protein LptC [Paludibacteraceae bacterium]MBR6686762.1 LPS export ABC transporter periplasmic protein LptC [Paludibacteraceae bacterium]
MRTLYKNIRFGITVAFQAIVILVLQSCSPSVENTATLGMERDSAAVMKTYNVTTLVSDSGITRFRVATPEWLVFDKKAKPTWEFPQGLHLEQFDENLEIHSEVDAKKAIYYTELEQWILSDSVYAVNVEGEKFESEVLYVHQKEDRIFTDKFVKITQEDKIITGIGMESNQRLTKYRVLKPQGIIPLDEDEETE